MKTLTNAGLVKLMLCASFAAALTACGGGGGSSAATASAGGSSNPAQNAQITGKAIDGYLSGATVCFDNGRGACDTTQPSATTDANGNYTLTPNGNIVGRQLLVIVSPTTKDLSRPGYTFPASFTLSGIVTNQTGQALVTPISSMVVAMMQSGMSQTAATTAVSTLLGEPVNLSTDYIAANDTTASTFATNVVNEVTSFNASGTTSAATVRAVLQAMAVNNTLTPTQTQVTTQASLPVYNAIDTSTILAQPTYGFDGYLVSYLGGYAANTTNQELVQDVRQLTNGNLTIRQQENVNGTWAAPAAGKYDAMAGLYELKADGSGFTPFVSIDQQNLALPISSGGSTLTGTDPNTGIGFTYELRSVDLSNQPLSTAVPISDSLYPLWTMPQLTGTNFAAGTQAYAGLLSYSADQIIVPVWNPDCGATTAVNGVVCGDIPAVMDGSQVVTVGSPTTATYTSLQQLAGVMLASAGGGANFQLAADGTVQEQIYSGTYGVSGTTTSYQNIGTWAPYSRNSSIAIVTFSPAFAAQYITSANNDNDPQTTQLLNGASTIVALVNGHPMIGWMYPASHTQKTIQFTGGLNTQLVNALNAAVTAASATMQ